MQQLSPVFVKLKFKRFEMPKDILLLIKKKNAFRRRFQTTRDKMYLNSTYALAKEIDNRISI